MKDDNTTSCCGDTAPTQPFDYDAAIRTLEEIALKVEDPMTPLGEIPALIAQASALVGQGKEFLRKFDVENQSN